MLARLQLISCFFLRALLFTHFGGFQEADYLYATLFMPM